MIESVFVRENHRFAARNNLVSAPRAQCSPRRGCDVIIILLLSVLRYEGEKLYEHNIISYCHIMLMKYILYIWCIGINRNRGGSRVLCTLHTLRTRFGRP